MTLSEAVVQRAVFDDLKELLQHTLVEHVDVELSRVNCIDLRLRGTSSDREIEEVIASCWSRGGSAASGLIICVASRFWKVPGFAVERPGFYWWPLFARRELDRKTLCFWAHRNIKYASCENIVNNWDAAFLPWRKYDFIRGHCAESRL